MTVERVPRDGDDRHVHPGVGQPAVVVDGLFQRNERAIVRFDTDHGPLDVVLVGAFGVGRITLSVCDLVTNADGSPSERMEVIEPPRHLDRGEELGVFHLGSTVILVAPPGRWRWTVRAGDPVRVGRPLAEAVAALTDRRASNTPQ